MDVEFCHHVSQMHPNFPPKTGLGMEFPWDGSADPWDGVGIPWDEWADGPHGRTKKPHGNTRISLECGRRRVSALTQCHIAHSTCHPLGGGVWRREEATQSGPRHTGGGRFVRECCGATVVYPSRRAESFSSMSRVMLSRSYVGFQSHSWRAHRHQEHFRPGMMLLAGLARLFERRVCTRSRPAWAVRMAPLLCRRAEVQKLLATLSAEYLDCARRDDPVATTAAHSLPMLIV